MSGPLRIRLYNVRFGDAILVTVPDADDDGRPLDRHILIDVGNVLAGDGGSDDVYQAVLDDIVAMVGDRGVDLYVMTHEHLDHVQGLLFGSRLDPPRVVPIDTVWLTRSADPDYYDTFVEARKAFERSTAVYGDLERQLAVSGNRDRSMATMMVNNNPRRTADCVAYLRAELTEPHRVHYVHRGFDTTAPGVHPFRRASFQIWAPEEDSSVYYGRFRPMAFGLPARGSTGNSVSAAGAAGGAADDGRGEAETGVVAIPYPGIDAGSFYNLIARRAGGAIDNALAIDKARNNTSVVFTVTVAGRVLLFAGDAETRSWRTMNKLHDDQAEDFRFTPVDFFKVSHHGSHNGTPDDDILDKILPPQPGAGRVAGVSTCADTYQNVPDRVTTSRLEQRVDEVVTTEIEGELYQEIVIETTE